MMVNSSFRDLFKRSPKTIRRTTIFLALGIVVLIAITVLLLIKIQAYRSPELSAQDKVRQLTAEVGKAVVLPDAELPAVATVQDPERLKGEAFFANAEVGDQVLIYTQAKRAILWRPRLKKVVEASSLDMALPPTSTQTGN